MIDFSLYDLEFKDVVRDLAHHEMKNLKRTYKGYMFNCPLCGDKKQRGLFLLDNHTKGMKFYCHNAGCDGESGISANKFLKKNYPDYYRTWLQMCMTAHREDETARAERERKRSLEAYNVKRRVPQIKQDEDRADISDVTEFINKNRRNLLTFDTIRNYPAAIDWCKKRFIPEHVYSKWLFVPNEEENFLRNRIIIPFNNKDGDMYFYQARTLGSDIPKYKNSISDLRPIYNYYEANFNKPVIIVEGPIDSHFIENCIATLGTSFNNELLEPIKQKYFLFDNDKAGKDAALKQLELGEYVFMWKRFISNFAFQYEKIDFNNLAIMLKKQLFTFAELEPYFTNNIMLKGFL